MLGLLPFSLLRAVFSGSRTSRGSLEAGLSTGLGHGPQQPLSIDVSADFSDDCSVSFHTYFTRTHISAYVQR